MAPKEEESSVMPSFDRRAGGIAPFWLVQSFSYSIHLLSLLVESILESTNGCPERASDQSRSQRCDITWLTSTKHLHGDKTLTHPLQWMHFIISYTLLRVVAVCGLLLLFDSSTWWHEKCNWSSSSPRKNSHQQFIVVCELQCWLDEGFCFSKSSILLYPILSFSVPSFVQPVAPLSRNTHLDAYTHTHHTHTKIIRWEALTVRVQ